MIRRSLSPVRFLPAARRFLLAVAALVLVPGLLSPVEAQEPPSGFSAAEAPTPDEREVLEVVDRLFDGMRARDGQVVASAFHPDAQMAVAVDEGAAPATPPVQSARGFIESVGAGGPSFHEPYFDPEVRIDGNLAHVWTFFQFYAGDEFSHCGYNSFQLVRTDRGWEIIFVGYTRRTEDCRRG